MSRRCAALGIVLLTGAGALSSRVAEGTVSDALELRISVPKETFVQGEPVPIRVEIRNRSEEAVEVIPMFEPQYIYSSLRFRVTDPEGETWTAEPSRQVSIGYRRGMALNLGDRLTHTVLLHFGVVRGAGRFVFRDTGRYVVEARYYDVASSEPIGITIIEAQGLEIQARCLFTGEQGELTIALGASQGAVDSFHQIIREYPTSIFAPHANHLEWLAGYKRWEFVVNDFDLYLMYRPSPQDSDNIWVPVGRLVWGFVATAESNDAGTTWTKTAGGHTIPNPNGFATTLFPEWPDKYSWVGNPPWQAD